MIHKGTMFGFAAADKAHPALVGDIDSGYAQRLGTDGTHLFLAGTNMGLLSYDLADPDHPVQIGISDTFSARPGHSHHARPARSFEP